MGQAKNLLVGQRGAKALFNVHVEDRLEVKVLPVVGHQADDVQQALEYHDVVFIVVRLVHQDIKQSVQNILQKLDDFLAHHMHEVLQRFRYSVFVSGPVQQAQEIN